MIESIAPGGQAGASSKIENYLGFPTGISGQRLASRAQLQALKFGVQFAISRPVVKAEQIDGIHRLSLADGIPVCSRSVVVASGAQYRALSLTNNSRFENRGIYYAATAMESLLCRDNEVIVVGGGNSAGAGGDVSFGNRQTSLPHHPRRVAGDAACRSILYHALRIPLASRFARTVRSRNSKANHPWSASRGQIASQGSG